MESSHSEQAEYSDIHDPYVGGQGDEYLADYDPEVLQRLMEEEQYRLYEQMKADYSVYNDCIKPAASQGLQSIWFLLLMCLLLRILSLLKPPPQIINIASAVCGCLVLWHFYEQSMIHILLPCAVGFVLLKFKATCKGSILSLISVAYLLSCEKLFLDGKEWNKIRGSVMIVSMKLIHIGFDTTNGVIPFQLSSLEYYGYILNPASIIFGPFLTYKDYKQLLQGHKVSSFWILHSIRATGLAILCLLWSTCGTSNVLSLLGENRWIVAYSEANAFRFSHYFVCYTSEASCLITGIGSLVKSQSATKLTVDKEKRPENGSMTENDGNKNESKEYVDRKEVPEDAGISQSSFKVKENKEKLEVNGGEEVETVVWTHPIANPLAVEVPRSLVEVVTNWNLPMHFWLKNYVFKPSRYLGIFPAILLTYVGSSMLHGLNFQLSAVLLSIGIFAYVENAFRHMLATTFDACIEARQCRTDCRHTHKGSNFWVIAVNLGFGFLAVWNLAYLGCLFDSNPEVEEKKTWEA